MTAYEEWVKAGKPKPYILKESQFRLDAFLSLVLFVAVLGLWAYTLVLPLVKRSATGVASWFYTRERVEVRMVRMAEFRAVEKQLQYITLCSDGLWWLAYYGPAGVEEVVKLDEKCPERDARIFRAPAQKQKSAPSQVAARSENSVKLDSNQVKKVRPTAHLTAR